MHHGLRPSNGGNSLSTLAPPSILSALKPKPPLMVVFLIFRPSGIMGKAKVEKV